jgi:hypothetical protein
VAPQRARHRQLTTPTRAAPTVVEIIAAVLGRENFCTPCGVGADPCARAGVPGSDGVVREVSLGALLPDPHLELSSRVSPPHTGRENTGSPTLQTANRYGCDVGGLSLTHLATTRGMLVAATRHALHEAVQRQWSK